MNKTGDVSNRCTRNSYQKPGNPFNTIMMNPKSILLPLQALARSFGSTSHQHLPTTAAGLPGAVAVPIGRFLPPSTPPKVLDPVSTGQLLGLLTREKKGGVRQVSAWLGRDMAGFERNIDGFSEVFSRFKTGVLRCSIVFDVPCVYLASQNLTNLYVSSHLSLVIHPRLGWTMTTLWIFPYTPQNNRVI